MGARYKRSWGDAVFDNGQGYRAHSLYKSDSALIIGSLVGAGGCGPGQHVHEFSDQMYYVTAGTMKVQLGAEVFDVGPESLVWIPQGVPHHNWNTGDDDELHFEVLAPVPFVSQPIATPTNSTDAKGRGYFVRTLDEVGFTEAMPKFHTATLLGRSDGSEHVSLYVGQVDPGGAGPDTHIHRFDQYYYVLEGELTVEIATDALAVHPGELAVIPAGVPHRQYNAGSVTERHLTLLVPEPLPGEPWDIGVDFTATGVLH